MKKLLILLLFISPIIGYSQCGEDIKSLGISTNMKGLTLEISHIAQETKLGFILGSTLSLKREVYESYGWSEEKGENVSTFTETGNYLLKGSIHLYGTYKLIHKEYNYSLHVLAGGVFDEDRGGYLSGGLEFRKPINTKCIFIRGLLPYDFRVGILFQL